MSLLTLRLDSATLQQRGYLGIETGSIHEIVILSDLVTPGTQNDPENWYATWSQPEMARLQQIDRSHYAYIASISETFIPPSSDLPLHYALLATTPPFTLLSLLPEQGSSAGLEPDGWVYGLTSLRMSWPELLEVPLSEVVQVLISDMRRLVLQPGYEFGQMISLSTLPPAPLGPDQLYLDVELVRGLAISLPPR